MHIVKCIIVVLAAAVLSMGLLPPSNVSAQFLCALIWFGAGGYCNEKLSR